jgi:alpha-L-arabinofuranosidase
MRFQLGTVRARVALLVVVIIVIGWGVRGRTARPATAQFGIAMDAPRHVVPRELFGSNIRWESGGDGILAVANGATTWNQRLLSMIPNVGVTTVRFPGGTLADMYDWRAGIGAAPSRPHGMNLAGRLEPSHFGSPELMSLARAANLGATVTINFSSTPEDAADWVEYMNGAVVTPMGARRAADGHAAPLGVKYWEIGNEIYNPMEPGHADAATYADRFLAFQRAIKARDPSAKVGAILEASLTQASWLASAFPAVAAWNEEVLSRVGRSADFFVVHLYGPFDIRQQVSDADVRRLALAAPDVLAENVLALADRLRAYGPNAEFVVSEYGEFIDPDANGIPGRVAMTEGALFNALMLMKLIDMSNVTHANQWSLVNNYVFGMMTTESGRVSTRPLYELFSWLAKMGGGRVLPVTGSSDTYNVSAGGNVPSRGNIAMVQGTAVRRVDGSMLAVFINRSPDTEVRTTIRVTDLERSAFTVRTLTPTSERTGWTSVQATVNVSSDGALHHVLPPESFAVIESTAN